MSERHLQAQIQPMYRLAQTQAIDREARTFEAVWAAGAQVRRYDFWRDEAWIEELDMSPEAVDLSRMNSGAPLLNSHRRHDLADVLGVVERAWLADGQGMAKVRFSARPDVAPVMQDVADRVVRNISVGYDVLEMKQVGRDEKTGMRIMRATKWQPFEMSLVPVGADAKAQTRSNGETTHVSCAITLLEHDPDTRQATPTAALAAQPGDVHMDATTQAAAAGATADVQAQATPQQFEAQRVKAIEHFCKANKIDERAMRHWIAEGTSVDVVGAEILKIVDERGKSAANPAALGLTRSETERFSVWRALQAVESGDWSRAGFELEASRAVADKFQRQPRKNSFFVPLEVQQRQFAKRDASVGGTGGYLVSTDNLGGSFIELLRNRTVTRALGARVLSGLVGNVTIPKQSAGATAYWLANESTQITEGNQTFGQLALSPKTVGAYTEISRLLQLQSSPDAEGIIMEDLAKQVAVAADLAALAGSGSAGQPQGLIGTGSVGSVTGASFDVADILEFQTDVATANALDGALAYLTTPTVAALCMQRVWFSNTASPLWVGSQKAGMMAGFPALSSNQVPAGDMIFGDWSQLVIGEWGLLEIATNPQANFQAGIIGVRAFYTMDVGVRIPAAFSVMTSAS